MILRPNSLKHKPTQADFVCSLTQCKRDRVNNGSTLISFAQHANTHEAPLSSTKRLFTNPFILLSLLIGIIGLNSTHQLSKQYHTQKLSENLEEAAHKASQQIDSELAKFQQIPNLLSHDPRLINYFTLQNSKDRLNQLLLEWSKQSLADTIYVHDLTGEVVGSSNFQKQDSFVGQNFAYRPYFQEAAAGNNAQYVALGARSNLRGYFLSAPLIQNNRILGVITVKVSLENIEQLITSDTSNILVLDSNQIIFLSSNPDWLYQSIQPLPVDLKQAVITSRQYGEETISPVPFISEPLSEYQNVEPNTLVTNHRYSLFPMAFNDKNGYQVIAIKDSQQLLKNIVQADFIFIVIYCLMILIAWSWRQTYKAKQALTSLNQLLEAKVEKRTQHLQQTNTQLQQTIYQYQQSQERLKQTEEELTQAAKLAVLGELSASINHEINQPLAALRTYSENSLKLLALDKHQMVAANLEKMIALNQSIAEIIARLKVFTRKVEKQDHHQANLHDTIHNATSLLSPQIIRQGVTLRIPMVPSQINIGIHPTEFEQVLVNLIHNAIQALSNVQSPQLGIEWKLTPSHCEILVWDNGEGIPDEKLPQLFDPFFTTKPEGLGLGLSISKRIIEAYHGSITAEHQPPNGMVFSIILPLHVSTEIE